MKILVLTKNLQNYGGGEKLYTYYLLKSLKEIGNDIVVENLVTSRLDETSLKTDFIYKSCNVPINNFHKVLGSFVSNFYSSGSWNKDYFRQVLDEISSDLYDFVLIDGLWMGRYAIEINRLLPKKNKKIILINHNVEFLNTLERATLSRSVIERLYFYSQFKRVKDFENEVIQGVENVIVLSPKDKKLLCESFKLDDNKVNVIRPLVRFDELFTEKLERKNNRSRYDNNELRILFVGTLSWYPNVTGISWFVQKVFSKLIQTDKHIKMVLVGRRASKSITKLVNQYKGRIEVYQNVEDVTKFYETSHCVVIPIFNGTGIKIKVLEAFASMKPTILSSYVAKDYGISKDEFLVCDTEDEFIEAILKLKKMTDQEVEILAQKQRIWYLKYIDEGYKEIQNLLAKISSV